MSNADIGDWQQCGRDHAMWAGPSYSVLAVFTDLLSCMTQLNSIKAAHDNCKPVRITAQLFCVPNATHHRLDSVPIITTTCKKKSFIRMSWVGVQNFLRNIFNNCTTDINVIWCKMNDCSFLEKYRHQKSASFANLTSLQVLLTFPKYSHYH